MNKIIEIIVGPLMWAFVIIGGGMMITPGGIEPIVTNPVLRIAIGAISIVLGVVGFYSQRGKSARS